MQEKVKTYICVYVLKCVRVCTASQFTCAYMKVMFNLNTQSNYTKKLPTMNTDLFKAFSLQVQSQWVPFAPLHCCHSPKHGLLYVHGLLSWKETEKVTSSNPFPFQREVWALQRGTVASASYLVSMRLANSSHSRSWEHLQDRSHRIPAPLGNSGQLPYAWFRNIPGTSTRGQDEPLNTCPVGTRVSTRWWIAPVILRA